MRGAGRGCRIGLAQRQHPKPNRPRRGIADSLDKVFQACLAQRMHRWARHFDNCKSCHCNDTKHVANGLCARCYSADYAANNKERVAAQKHDWYVRSGGKVLAKVQREQRHYSGLRDAVLARDGHRCVICGSVVALVVHHKDGQGRGTPNPNNKMSNLETRCRACHLSACRQCGRSDRKHNADGLCFACYSKKRFHDTKPRRLWVKSIRRYKLLPKG